MTPELNKTEGLPDAAEPDATRRISAGAAEQAEAAEPEETKPPLARFERHIVRARDGRKTGPAGKAEQNRKERRPKQGSIGSCRRGHHHDLRVSGHVLKFERHEGPRREQDETESRQAGDHGDRNGREPRVRDAAAECGHERAGCEQRSTQRGRRKGNRAIARAPAAETRGYARQYPAHGSGSGGISPGEGRQPCSAASASGRERSRPRATASAGP